MGRWIAGFAVLIVGPGAAELEGLFVEPKFWRRGVGALLVEEAVHRARVAGLSLTAIAAPGAKEFYEKCGFSVERETETRFGPALLMSR